MITLTTAASETITLPDGRKLAYKVYGKQDGFPVFAFHGTPGSRIWFKDDDPVSHKVGIKLITVDRPGYGLSDFQKDRKTTDFTSDIKILAEHLKLDLFSVLGISGGSIYAACCAHSLPGIYKAALIAGVNEFEKGKPPKNMCSQNRLLFNTARYFPFFIRMFTSYGRKMMYTNPEKYIEQVQSQVDHLCISDQQVIQDPDNAEQILRHLKEAFRPGIKGNIADIRLVTKTWGFEPQQIKVPVEIWHGVEDTLAPIDEIKKLSTKIPECKKHWIEGKGHFLDADPTVWEKILTSVGV